MQPKFFKIIWFSVLLFAGTRSYGQKKSLDTAAVQNWPGVGGSLSITNDGKYAGYSIFSGTKTTWILRQSGGSWERKLPGYSPAGFTMDSHWAIGQKNDTLALAKLNSLTTRYITNVSQSNLLSLQGKTWVLYKESGSNLLFLFNPVTGVKKSLGKVNNYTLSPGNDKLAIERDSTAEQTVSLCELPSGKIDQVWKGQGLSSFTFNETGDCLAFVSTPHAGQSKIIFYDSRVHPFRVFSVDSLLLSTGFRFERIMQLSAHGHILYLSCKDTSAALKIKKGSAVDIWNYKDGFLQSEQSNILKDNRWRYINFCLDLQTGIIRKLRRDDSEIVDVVAGLSDRLVIIRKNAILAHSNAEDYWNKKQKLIDELQDLVTGERTVLPKMIADIPVDQAESDYLVLKDPDEPDFYSYQLSTHTLTNLTSELGLPLVDQKWIDLGHDRPNRNLLLSCRINDDHHVLIYDTYDPWIVDLSGREKAICLTNEFGRKNNIQFTLLPGTLKSKAGIIRLPENFTVANFNFDDKKEGFYEIVLSRIAEDPIQLSQAAVHCRIDHFFNGSGLSCAENGKGCLVSVETAEKSANIYFTKDFKAFKPISDFYPEKQYNWLTAELISFPSLSGARLQGVLYKPENFDASKKYPVIFYFYEGMSDNLHHFLTPGLSLGAINIPWFVSHGYLVCTPDILYTIGEPGASALNCVVSAAKYLAQFPWVDSARMGLNGHSWGAFECNYIVTHSHCFAAAVSGSGVSDMISHQGSQMLDGSSLMFMDERSQNRMEASLWENPQRYIDNSPIFNANKITTPLLMMANKGDVVVPYQQGRELFISMRRLQKKAWLLEYDDEGHVLFKPKNQMDMTIRLDQFFGYYLKGEPAPKWMVEGIPARMKQIDAGYEPEPGIEPQ